MKIKKIFGLFGLVAMLFVLSGCFTKRIHEDYTKKYKDDIDAALGDWKIVDTKSVYEPSNSFLGGREYFVWTLQFKDSEGELREVELDNNRYYYTNGMYSEIMSWSETVLSEQNKEKLYKNVNKKFVKEFKFSLNTNKHQPKDINIKNIQPEDVYQIYIKTGVTKKSEMNDLARKTSEAFGDKFAVFVENDEGDFAEYNMPEIDYEDDYNYEDYYDEEYDEHFDEEFNHANV